MDSKIKVYKDTHIYILAPAFFKTGGTELLHQYCSVLNKHGFNADMVYFDNHVDEYVVNPAFRKYVTTFLSLEEVIDDEKNIFIVPETETKFFAKYSKIRKIIWWESVDNYFASTYARYFLKSRDLKFKDKLSNALLRYRNPSGNLKVRQLHKVDYHFAQSYYAIDFLKKHHIEKNVFFVSDYINDLYLEYGEVDCSKKEDFVCYNPKKGKKYTDRLIAKFPEIKFVPLINMTNEQVLDTLLKVKIYIDFGNHPGKDRFPREAAILHCAIITNKRGAAAYHDDVPIDEIYKFKDSKCNLRKIGKTIKDIFVHYSEVDQKYEGYRKYILSEKAAFEKDVVNSYTRVK